MLDGSEDTLIKFDRDVGLPVELLVKTTNEIRPVSKHTTAGQKCSQEVVVLVTRRRIKSIIYKKLIMLPVLLLLLSA
jgi:hypothetical protein